MTDVLKPITVRTFGLCEECGAVVHDEARHFEWHADQLPDDLPEQVSDPWDEAVADMDVPRRGWNLHLASALRNCAGAVGIGGDDAGHLRGCLVIAAAHVRAMAPEGTTWEEPWQVQQGTERNTLRSVIRSLVHADTKHGPSPADTAGGLVAADAYLHGLWLAAQEVG